MSHPRWHRELTWAMAAFVALGLVHWLPKLSVEVAIAFVAFALIAW